MIRKRATTSILFPWLHEDAANFNSLESVPLIFNEQYRIILCTICRHALSLRHAGRHVKNKHSSRLDSATNLIIESWALATNADDKQTFDVNIRLPHPYPHLCIRYFSIYFATSSCSWKPKSTFLYEIPKGEPRVVSRGLAVPAALLNGQQESLIFVAEV